MDPLSKCDASVKTMILKCEQDSEARIMIKHVLQEEIQIENQKENDDDKPSNSTVSTRVLKKENK
eukprot:582300-Ditylum_brightwellii.AAC.1